MMEFNFDLLVAGCNTRCRHCYVDGGPGPMMPTEIAVACIKKLDAIAAHLSGEVTFTLDNEPMNHPHLDIILQAAAHTRFIRNYHHGMTTGIALMRRPDRADVLRAYFRHGYRHFGLTLHGFGAHHDELVGRVGAFETALETARFLKAQGASIEISLMLNRFFPEDREALSRVLDELKPDVTFGAIPIFTPHRHMLAFEPYRATEETFHDLTGYLSHWALDESALMASACRNTVRAFRENLAKHPDLADRFSKVQEEMYLTIHPDGKLYYGNTGVETRCLGELPTLDARETATLLRTLPGNRDYGAFYSPRDLQSEEVIYDALEQLPQDLVYGDPESILYRAFVHLGTPTILLSGHH